MRWILLAVLLLCGFTGCDAKDATAFTVNLDKLNWQTGALIVLAYLANSRGHASAIAKAALGVLRGLKLLPAADSKESLSAEEVAKLLAGLYVQLKGHPELQDGILKLMTPRV
jgi:hypothetical protein